MPRPIFYNNTIKNLIVTFGSLFNEVSYINDDGTTIKVPIHYSPREKFVEYFQNKEDFDEADIETVLPRFGFEIQGMNFAPERYNNPLSRMIDNSSVDENRFMFSRQPYDFSFVLYLATRKFEDSLKIVEQILPFFTPELNVSIHDKEDYGLITDIPIVLNSSSYEIDYEGTFDTKRTIMWTFQFTMKAWLYSNSRNQTRIKETITSLTQPDFDQLFSKLTAVVDPRTANKNDIHTVVETKIDG